MLISNIYFKVYTHFNLVPDCFLIFWFCIKGNQVYYTWMIYTPVILVSIQLPFSHWNMGFLWSVFSLVWAELYPYFPIFGRNLKFCPSKGKCGYNSVHIWENKDQRKPGFRYFHAVESSWRSSSTYYQKTYFEDCLSTSANNAKQSSKEYRFYAGKTL